MGMSKKKKQQLSQTNLSFYDSIHFFRGPVHTLTFDICIMLLKLLQKRGLLTANSGHLICLCSHNYQYERTNFAACSKDLFFEHNVCL